MSDKNPQQGIGGRLLKQSSFYALGNVLLKLSGLALAVLYLNPAYLSVQAFGYFGLLIVTANLGIFVMGLGIGQGLLKFLTDPDKVAHRNALPFTALAASLVVVLVGLAILWGGATSLATLLLDHPEEKDLIRLMALYVAFKALGNVPLVVMRAEEKVGWYVGSIVLEASVLIGSAYLFMVSWHLELWGLLAAYVVSSGLSTLFVIIIMMTKFPFRFHREMVGPLIRFGTPLVMASLGGWFLNAGDRYLLKWLDDIATVGLYEWAARLAGVLNMLFVQSFNLAFTVIGLKTLGSEGLDSPLHREVQRHYIVWTGWAVLGLSLLTRDLTRMLPANAYYLEADILVFLLALGFMIYGIYYININIVYASGRTQALGVNVMGAALLNMVLNLVMIPWQGALGAALATVVSYLCLALWATWLARKDAPITFPWRVFLLVVGIIGTLFLAGLPSASWSPWWGFGVRVGLILAYLPLVLLCRLYSLDELRQAYDFLLKNWRERTR